MKNVRQDAEDLLSLQQFQAHTKGILTPADYWCGALAYIRGDRPKLDSPAAANELRDAARAFYNATVADKEVRISTNCEIKRDGVVAAGERLRAAVAKPTNGDSNG